MLQFILTIFLLIPIIVESKGEWSYENSKTWSRGNRYCGGNLQSPINLQFNVSLYDRRLQHMFLEETSSRDQVELVNNGHTAQLNFKNHYVLKNVAPESEDYNVEQIHFHWGHTHDDVNGSEHLYEGRSYPLEMHIVTYSNWYQNISDAMSNTRALAVVGVFFELSNESNPLLQPLVDALEHVRRHGERTVVSEKFNVKALVGEERLHRYYRYDGSLTTPPCYESVVWTIVEEPIKLSFEQLHCFRYLHDHHAKVMENTYRKVQPLRTRRLFRSFPSKDIHEHHEPRSGVTNNNAQYLSINMNLIVILTSLLMSVF